MVKSVTPDAISIILSNPSPDSSTEISEIVVQVVDLKPAGNTYMFTASDGKTKVKTILQSNLSSEVISGNIQNLGLICILDYIINDSPTKNEKYLIVKKCETVSPALEAEIKTQVKGEETDTILKPKQEMVIKTEVDEAKEMFAKIIGRPFKYEHCWNILKMERKWTDNLTSNKRAKTHSIDSPVESDYAESCYSTSYLGDDIEPSSTPSLDRPLGRKVSKKQLKNKEKQTGVEVSLDHYHWNQRMEVERQKVAQQEIALEQHRRQLEIEERQVQETARQNEWQKEMKIMETNTTGMDPISASYWNNLKLEIMNKRGFNF